MKPSPVYNFLGCAVLHFLINSYFFNPCMVPLDSRQDCGFPGIDGTTCQMFGKLSIVARNPQVLIKMLVTFGVIFGVTIWAFFDSGFPKSVGFIYVALALVTTYESTKCCHDSTMSELEEQIVLLQEQLKLARQKASLYYIAVSELESLKRSNEKVHVFEPRNMATCTRDLNHPQFLKSQETQTEPSSCSLERDLEISQMVSENAKLKSTFANYARTEKSRMLLENRLKEIIQAVEMNQGQKNVISIFQNQYREMFDEVLRQNKESVNHSVEIKRRDALILSLFEKIRIMESAFAQKLSSVEEMATSRLGVIHELGNQVKEATAFQYKSESQVFDWQDMAAIHSELEDVRAELSKARSNWVATKDELMRLQFRVGSDGNGGSEFKDGFPSPVCCSVSSEDGILSGIRNIRKNQHK